MVDVEPVKVPELLKTVPVPGRVMVYELALNVPAVIVRALETVVLSCNVYVPPNPFCVRL